MAQRKRGRPPKVGRWKYWLRTGNPSNLVTAVYDTDTEVKRAAQKFFNSFEESTRRFGTKDEQARLQNILIDLDTYCEKPDRQNDRVTYRYSFEWGSAGTMTAVAIIDQAKPTETPAP